VPEAADGCTRDTSSGQQARRASHRFSSARPLSALTRAAKSAARRTKASLNPVARAQCVLRNRVAARGGRTRPAEAVYVKHLRVCVPSRLALHAGFELLAERGIDGQKPDLALAAGAARHLAALPTITTRACSLSNVDAISGRLANCQGGVCDLYSGYKCREVLRAVECLPEDARFTLPSGGPPFWLGNQNVTLWPKVCATCLTSNRYKLAVVTAYRMVTVL